jgi:hypothetical protein
MFTQEGELFFRRMCPINSDRRPTAAFPPHNQRAMRLKPTSGFTIASDMPSPTQFPSRWRLENNVNGFSQNASFGTPQRASKPLLLQLHDILL